MPARRIVPSLLGTTLVLAGCGTAIRGTDTKPGHGAASARHGAPSRATARPSADADEIRVIRAWATALRRGEIATAAGYFATPSLFANGGEEAEIRSRHDAEIVNASLSCGARLVATQHQGRFLLATFRLTARTGPGAGCGSGTGGLGATDFLIRHGKIVEWIRAVVPTSAAPGSGNSGSGNTGPGSSGSGNSGSGSSGSGNSGPGNSGPGNSGVPTTASPSQQI